MGSVTFYTKRGNCSTVARNVLRRDNKGTLHTNKTNTTRKMSILIALVALGAPALRKPMETGGQQTTIAIIMDFEEPYSDSVLEAIQDETERILRPSGLQLEWRFYEKSPIHRGILNREAVIRFQGRCRAGDPPPAHVKQSALALTHLSGKVVLPYADVHCDQVWNLIQDEIRPKTPPRTEVLLGRAVGRVLAHELYHVLAKTTKHAAAGLAKAGLSAQELVSRQQGLDKGALGMIRESLAAPRADDSALECK